MKLHVLYYYIILTTTITAAVEQYTSIQGTAKVVHTYKLLSYQLVQTATAAFVCHSPGSQYAPTFIHRESKKQDIKLLAITSLNIIRF